MQQQRGFTLIELMIVIAIIAILANFALPAYGDYTKRAYVTEGLSLATAAKTAAIETYTTTGRVPENNAEAGLPLRIQLKGKALIECSSLDTIWRIHPYCTYKLFTIKK